MNHYTPLSLSRKIASLGVECESEHYWVEGINNGSIFRAHEQFSKSHKDGVAAYSLGELPPVLQAIGAVKGWDKLPITETWFMDDSRVWAYHFLEIARLYIDSPEIAWKYLSDLLDNN